MTDINGWPSLIERKCPPEWGTGYDDVGYIMLPMNEYQMGFILGMLKNSPNSGDWWGELVSIILVAMEQLDIQEVDGFGTRFTPENIRDGSAFIKEDE